MSSPQIDQDTDITNGHETKSDLLYGVDERPPWYLWLLLSFQNFFLTVTSVLPVPLILAKSLCMLGDDVGVADLTGTIIFVAGIASILQTTFGIRLPIIQGPSAVFILPVIMMMKANAKKCPDFDNTDNSTLPFQPASEEHKALWKSNLSETQGALLLASVVEMLLGFSGLIGVLMRYIGPLTTGSVLILLALTLSTVASDSGSTHWWICFVCLFLIALFSQYLANFTIPFFGGQRIRIFLLFSVLLGMGISWLICFILTETGALPERKGEWGYDARTDIKLNAIRDAAWVRFPYPGQWGLPTIRAGSVVAMAAGVLASIIESVGDYYACARLCHVPVPPGSAISRGIGMEGICCLISGACGACLGLTSYSHNIATIGLTKVASRIVVQGAGILLVVAGCWGKLGALFSIVPPAVIGGMLYAMVGMILAAGISNIGLADVNSTRNMFVFGLAIFFGFSAPAWVAGNPFTLGNDTANEVLSVFCGNSVLIGGVLACVLDNTIPGSLQERGMMLEKKEDDIPVHTGISAYDLPLIQSFISRVKCFRFVPFCPGFIKDDPKPRSPHSYNLDIEKDTFNLQTKSDSSPTKDGQVGRISPLQCYTNEGFKT